MGTILSEMRLYDHEGQRLYLTEKEREQFLNTANEQEREKRMFCHVLHYTGCRPSEALELSPSKVKLIEKSIIIRTLKKRSHDNQGRKKKPHFRHVPVPEKLIENFDLVFDLRGKKNN